MCVHVFLVSICVCFPWASDVLPVCASVQCVCVCVDELLHNHLRLPLTAAEFCRDKETLRYATGLNLGLELN